MVSRERIRQYRSQSQHADDPFDELYRQYDRQNGSPPSTPGPNTGGGSRIGAGQSSFLREFAALEGSIDLLAQRVWELTNVLRMDMDGREEEETEDGP